MTPSVATSLAVSLPPRTPQEIAADKRAKATAKAAFLAYEAAVRDGDTEAAEAARLRFLNASAVLAGRRPR